VVAVVFVMIVGAASAGFATRARATLVGVDKAEVVLRGFDVGHTDLLLGVGLRADKPRDGGARLADLFVRNIATFGNGFGDAMAEMVLEQSERNRFQSFRCGRYLGENVYAICVVFDHPVDTTDLPLSPAQPLQKLVLVRYVADHSLHPALLSGYVGDPATMKIYHTPQGYVGTQKSLLVALAISG
jgi:hypothetical protein